MQQRTAFRLVWFLAGITALVLYVLLPASILPESVESPDGTTFWFNAMWLVPSVVVVAGFVLALRLPRIGALLVLAGSLVLVPCTLFYFLMALAVWMAACHVTLILVGVVGVIGDRRPSWGPSRWVLLLGTPIVVGVVAGVGVWFLPGTGWQAEGVEFPLAQQIRFRLDREMAVEVAGEPEAASETPGETVGARQYLGVDEFPWEGQGSFETSLDVAMRDQRSVLQSEGWSVTVGPPAGGSRTMTARKSDFEAVLRFEQATDPGAGRTGTVVLRLSKR